LARWALALQPYKFVTNYKEGKKLTAANGISRRKFAETTCRDFDEVLAEDLYIAAIDDDLFTEKTADDVTAAPRRWTDIHLEYEDYEKLTTLR